MVEAEFDKVLDFYKLILSRGYIIKEEKLMDDLYILKGKLKDKKIEVKTGSIQIYDNFKSYIRISIKGDFGNRDLLKDYKVNLVINDVNIENFKCAVLINIKVNRLE